MPIPPCIWIASFATRIAASEQRAFASDTSEAASAAPASTARAGRHEEQADAAAVVFRPGAARDHDEGVGHAAVEHGDLLAAEAESAAARLGARRHAVQVEAAAALLLREREERVAAHDRLEPALLLRLAAGELQHLTREQHRGEERLRREMAAELLEHDRELGEPHPRPAERLR